MKARVLLVRAHLGARVQLQGKVALVADGRIEIGDRVCFLRGPGTTELIAHAGGRLAIGSQSYINYNCIINATDAIEIGSNCRLGYGVLILDNDMHGTDAQDRTTRPPSAPVRIASHVWIGSHAVILPGTTIGQGSVIAAGSVVSGLVPAGVVMAGNPGRIVRSMAQPVEPAADSTAKAAIVATEATADDLAPLVIQVIRETFTSEAVIDANTTASDVAGWDSLGQLRLLINLEQAFGVAIDSRQIAKLTSVGAIAALIYGQRQGRGASPPPSQRPLPTRATSARKAVALRPGGDSAALKVAVLRNYTAEPLLDLLKGEISYAGFRPDLYINDYDTILPTVLDQSSSLYQFNPELIIVTQVLEALSPRLVRRFMAVKDAGQDEIERIIGHCQTVITALRSRTQAPILINNFPAIDAPVLGILDSQSSHLQVGLVQQLNARLMELCAASANTYLVDYQTLCARLGSEQAYDEKLWQMGKVPFTDGAFSDISSLYGRFIRALRGKAKKCLVLDCDNTLWGGIVGEDGALGVQLGGSFPGSSFSSLHSEILDLHDRGVILALCSKNNEQDALEVFRSNEHSLLKEEHFAHWEINWQDKASNLRSIAETLNIGLDSIVFVDDSPFECDLIRSQLPMVEVLQVPPRPEHMKGLLINSGWFDTLTLTAEDRVKNQLYRAESQRTKLREASTNLDDYLHSLGLKADIRAADAATVPRVAQLTQKTNQFNLTTKRYTEDDIRRFMATSSHIVYQLSVKDHIADFGLVGTAIVGLAEGEATIDTFLMSCRVLGRGVETALLNFILRDLQAQRVRQVKGLYAPSAKNQQVVDFYRKHGFQRLTDGEWTLVIDGQDFKSPAWIST